MSDEFDGLPAAPDGVGGEGPQDVTGQQGPKMVPETDLNNLRSIKDREVAEARRQAQEAQQVAEMERARAEAIVRTVEGIDPEAASAIVNAAEQAEREAELRARENRLLTWEEQQAQREAADRFRRDMFGKALSMGMDPSQYGLGAAIELALQTGSGAPVEECFIEFRADQKVAERQQGPAPAPAPTRPLPPSGGRAIPVQQDVLLAEYKKRLMAPDVQGRPEKIMALKREYREKGVDIP